MYVQQIIRNLSNEVSDIRRYIKDVRMYVRMYRDQMAVATEQLKMIKLNILNAQQANSPEAVSYYTREQNLYRFQYQHASERYHSMREELYCLHKQFDKNTTTIRELYRLME